MKDTSILRFVVTRLVVLLFIAQLLSTTPSVHCQEDPNFPTFGNVSLLLGQCEKHAETVSDTVMDGNQHDEMRLNQPTDVQVVHLPNGNGETVTVVFVVNHKGAAVSWATALRLDTNNATVVAPTHAGVVGSVIHGLKDRRWITVFPYLDRSAPVQLSQSVIPPLSSPMWWKDHDKSQSFFNNDLMATAPESAAFSGLVEATVIPPDTLPSFSSGWLLFVTTGCYFTLVNPDEAIDPSKAAKQWRPILNGITSFSGCRGLGFHPFSKDLVVGSAAVGRIFKVDRENEHLWYYAGNGKGCDDGVALNPPPANK